MLGIDPEAPDGPIFRRATLEELDAEAFDAVVASRSLHHIHDLAAAIDKVALAPLLVLDEFGWDLLDERTAEWYEGQRRVLVAAGGEPEKLDWPDGWEEEHRGLHTDEAMRSELDRRFEQRHFSWAPYLFRCLGGPVTRELERGLIDAGAISALGFRYAGVARSRAKTSG